MNGDAQIKVRELIKELSELNSKGLGQIELSSGEFVSIPGLRDEDDPLIQYLESILMN